MTTILKRILCLSAILFILLPTSSLTYADDQSVFGPKDLTISRWYIHLSFHSFTVDEPGDGILVVTKNTPDKEIPRGFIILNQSFIPLRDFLVGNDTVFEKTIPLVSSNHMIVFLTGTPGASITVEAKKNVTSPPPTVTFSAEPSTVTLGESSTLAWATTNAESVSIDQGIGGVSLNGSVRVSPIETTTYTIMAAGPGGAATDNVTVEVIPAPYVTISADPEGIQIGGSSTLSWSSSNADRAFIDNGIGTVPAEGSIAVSPEHTTTYTITVTGDLGSANARTTVKVTGNPAPLPEGSYGEQYADLIPPDATVEGYDPGRFSLITGLVQSIDDTPISDVSVTIHGHPEYGTAGTDVNGRFSIPVEGGGTITIVYQKQGLITSQRKVYVPWNDNAIAETIRMIVEDPISTTITFDGSPDTVVTHSSTEITDEFGSRSCTMVFKGDNRAYLVDEEGNDIHELTTITTRASEFATPESMPAILPPNSAYTYCAELSVDGVQRVRFDNPVITWVDNFLGFDVGEVVPVGYYDRDRGVWVPSDNGVVVRLLDTDTDGIVDALDANGDDQRDDLNGDGSFSDEVTGLGDAGRYTPGATFWRVEVTHFTPWDFNWPFGPPPDAIASNAEGAPDADQQKDEEKDCKSQTGSFVEERSRIFHEDISIPGTGITLHYASNRVDGYETAITVPASGETVPGSLKSIIVQVEVAGRTLKQILDPLPNQKAEFIWDGLDNLGRTVKGPVTAHISVGFVYDRFYYKARADFEQAFAQAGSDITDVTGRSDLISWTHSDLIIRKGEGTIAKGWTLSLHHQLSLTDPTIIQKGDGSISTNNAVIIDTVVGNGSLGYSGDGGPATEAMLKTPWNVTVDAAGNLYIADLSGQRIRKVDTDGIITTVAGNGNAGYRGDGVLATETRLYNPYDVAVDAAGNIYIADCSNYRVRKVDTDGIITTVAGTGTSGYSGDGGPATAAKLGGPYSVALDVEGNLYIGDSGNRRIRKVDTNGIITTVAGNGITGYGGDGGPATEAYLSRLCGVAVDSAGNLYIADADNDRVRKVDASGIITTVAGNGYYGYSGDGGPATEAKLNCPDNVAVDAVGNLYIADNGNHRVRRVDTSGIITTVAGNGFLSYSGDGGPAIEAGLNRPGGVAVDAPGNLYIADTHNYRIRKVGVPSVLAGYMIGGDIPFVEDSGLGYIMSSSGRHKKTIDLDTGVTLYAFGYDEDNNLVSITDRFGNETMIQRDGNGVPASITSPDGITTGLTIDANNHLTRITYPDGGVYGFEYTADGLMTIKTEPEGNRFGHQFDSLGRLTDATGEEDGHWHFVRTVSENGDILAEVTTGEGNLTSYLDHTYSTGKYTSTITDPTGAETLYTQSADGLTVDKSLSCGMDLSFKYSVDPEYRFKYVREMREGTPSLLEKITLRDKTYQDTNSDDIPDLITETVTTNGRVTILENDVLQSRKTIRSPEGRTVTSFYNSATLLTGSLAVPDFYETNYGYDSRGRLTSVNTNTRQTAFTYNDQGFLASIRDPENHTTSYSYDSVGRVTGINRPDGNSVGFTYDGNGNMTVLTTPSGVDHGFGFNRVNRNNSYHTPISGSYSYVYDKDRRLVQTNFPSGSQINNVYDKTRLIQIQTPEGNIDLTYLCSTKVGSITKGTDTLTYGYDGKLVTSETLSGVLSEVLSYTYNDDFNMDSFTYAENTEIYTYDSDGLLTGAGDFAIARNAQNGLPESVTGGALTLSRSFNGYGETAAQDFAISGKSLTSWDLVRDDNGKIINRAETIGSSTSAYIYTYDPMGRLLTVSKDDTPVEEYRYDLNGTRNYEMNSLRGITTGRTFTYSDEDHLLTAGTATYQYNLDGFLAKKTDGSDITSYEYSSRGELLGVTLPDGKTIDYIHDPLGRRIAKKVNGMITEKYLWQGLTRLLAVYDGGDNLIMRFEYADGRMPVAMTKDGSTYYLTYDQVGSLRVIADTSGTAVKQIDYDSFGNIIKDTNPTFTIPLGFAGGLYDRDTGLVRFGYRDYDPDTGRWTAKDPILFTGGDTDLYGYVLNDPVNLVDPSGEIGVAGAVIGIVAGAYGGFLSGITSGDMAAGIIGGVAGAAAGAIVGAFMPQASNIVGGMVGGAVSGFFGGAVGGATAKALSDPCASAGDIGRRAAKGAGIGALTGYMGGGMVASVAAVGAKGAAVHVCAAMFTAPISWGLGMINF